MGPIIGPKVLPICASERACRVESDSPWANHDRRVALESEQDSSYQKSIIRMAV
jgi:hypothetical protein